jgi:hypothetical protein
MAQDGSARPHWYHFPERRAAVRAALVAIVAAVPVALVNSVAFIGQFAYLNANVPWPVVARVLIAVTVESIAVYLAWHAHLAKMANDTAMRLVLGAYAVALLIATVNYSHFAHDWHPTPLAVIMGLASLISPLLWGVHTKRASRDKMMAMEPPLIDPHAVRLGGTRWLWHPVRSFRAMDWATWHGVNEPARVMAHFENRYGTAGTPEPVRQPRQKRNGTPRQPGERVHVGTVPWVQSVPPAAPVTVPDGATYQSAELLAGTELNGEQIGPQPAVHGAEASLEAHGSVSGGGRPSQAKQDEVEEWLYSLPSEQVDGTSIRAIARRLGDPNQRRLAADMKKARLAAGAQRIQPAANGHVNRGPHAIASPRGFLPGGAS